MTPKRRLQLYHRRGCHLCDEMLEGVEQLCIGHNVAVEVIDIEADPRLVEQYGHDIPVLTAGRDELSRHRLDRERLQQWLGRS